MGYNLYSTTSECKIQTLQTSMGKIQILKLEGVKLKNFQTLEI